MNGQVFFAIGSQPNQCDHKKRRGSQLLKRVGGKSPRR